MKLKEKNKKTEIRLARKEEMVYSCVDLKPKHLDEIIKLTDLELLEVQEILVKLELINRRANKELLCQSGRLIWQSI